MSAKLLGLSLLTVVGISALTVVGSYISNHNAAVNWEAKIARSDSGTKNKLSGYTMTMRDIAQVPDMLIEDFTKAANAIYEGRYGPDGSQAMMQWITEQNLPFDQSIYTRIADVITAGRKEFELGQAQKIELCEGYEAARRYVWTGFWMRVAGFPDRDIVTMCRIVLDSTTNRVFETFESEQIKLRN
jgi:hypothetical protein